MQQEERSLLRRKLLIYAESQRKEKFNDEDHDRICQKISQHMEKMINKGQIRSFLELESVFCFCLDKMQAEEKDVKIYAREILNFIS
ncbi:MAG: hypothetical protein ACNS62_19845 [Candidatus Cyclobacteriaceae bacterium M3_2C_046]